MAVYATEIMSVRPFVARVERRLKLGVAENVRVENGGPDRKLQPQGVFIATQLNSTQLNSTDPVEQRTVKSVVFLFMTSRPTN